MNIYDIARLADVSIATVSRVVNDSPKVSQQTKDKVRRIMADNDYTPNAFARGLGLGSMNTVGIVCPDVADIYMSKAVSYLEKNLQGYGYDCILYCSGYAEEDKQQAVERILKKQIDALIMVGSDYSCDAPKQNGWFRSVAARLPVFLINGWLEGDNIYSVLADDQQAVYDVTEELLFAGRREILFLSNSRSYSAMRKLEGYENALKAHGIPIDQNRILYPENAVYAVRDLLLRKRGLHFDSVIAATDELAVGALKYLHARGLRVPDEVSVIGCNNSELSICCEPELTTIDNRVEVLCKTTIDSVMTLLGGDTVKQKQIVKCHLVRRSTTDF
ncbi:MAG: LacI family transcriptional regulator [Lachnospiraceae bacterium]|nr:LacI family transcriptional regulator [Lachnospiraceae bacterium]